jgi:hypothetical protein
MFNMRSDSFVAGTIEKIAAIAYYRQISSNFPLPGMVGVEILRVKKLNLLAVVPHST